MGLLSSAKYLLECYLLGVIPAVAISLLLSVSQNPAVAAVLAFMCLFYLFGLHGSWLFSFDFEMGFRYPEGVGECVYEIVPDVRQVHAGPRGGVYRRTAAGNKVYV